MNSDECFIKCILCHLSKNGWQVAPTLSKLFLDVKWRQQDRKTKFLLSKRQKLLQSLRLNIFFYFNSSNLCYLFQCKNTQFDTLKQKVDLRKTISKLPWFGIKKSGQKYKKLQFSEDLRWRQKRSQRTAKLNKLLQDKMADRKKDLDKASKTVVSARKRDLWQP